jgi:hypothetical protein
MLFCSSVYGDDDGEVNASFPSSLRHPSAHNFLLPLLVSSNHTKHVNQYNISSLFGLAVFVFWLCNRPLKPRATLIFYDYKYFYARRILSWKKGQRARRRKDNMRM